MYRLLYHSHIRIGRLLSLRDEQEMIIAYVYLRTAILTVSHLKLCGIVELHAARSSIRPGLIGSAHASAEYHRHEQHQKAFHIFSSVLLSKYSVYSIS